MVNFGIACNHLESEDRRISFKTSTGTFELGFHILDESIPPIKRLLRSEGHRISKVELQKVLCGYDKFLKLLVMDYLDGNEFSVDVRLYKGTVAAMVCRWKPMRDEFRHVGTSKTSPVDESQSQIRAKEAGIEKRHRILADHFQFEEQFNVQFRTRADLAARPYVLEINSGISGGLAYVGLTGLNLPLLSIRFALCGSCDQLGVIPYPMLPLFAKEKPEIIIVPPRP
jgi:hypothetical protein